VEELKKKQKQKLNYEEFGKFITYNDIVGLTETKTDDTDNTQIHVHAWLCHI
jgi:hypothetical protein